MKITLTDGNEIKLPFPFGSTGYVASKIELEPSDVRSIISMLNAELYAELNKAMSQLLFRFESEAPRSEITHQELIKGHPVLSGNYFRLTNDQPGMLTGDELRKMYAEKLLEKNSWDDALFKICWRSFVAGVNTSSSVLLEIKRLSADLQDCPLKEFIERKILEVDHAK